jgi:hypothetical protein
MFLFQAKMTTKLHPLEGHTDRHAKHAQMFYVLSIAVFWVVTLCCLVDGYQHCEGTYCLYIQGEDGDDTSLRNDGNHLQDYAASQPRRGNSTFSVMRTLNVVSDSRSLLLYNLS